MESVKPKTMKVATDEKVAKTTKEDLLEELKLKKEQLKDKEARMNGGFSPLMGRDYMAIDEEIEQLGEVIKMKEIELSHDAPINPKYAYEQNETWRAIKRGFGTKELKQFEASLEKVKEQKETIVLTIPELKERIAKLEEETKVEVPKEKPTEKPVEEGETTEEVKEETKPEAKE